MINIITDHLGNEFKHRTEMCETYNISRPIYLRRLAIGWTQEEALMTPSYEDPDKYNRKHKDEIKKKKIRVRNKIYRTTNKEEVSAYQKAYQEAHKEEINAYNRFYRDTCKAAV